MSLAEQWYVVDRFGERTAPMTWIEATEVAGVMTSLLPEHAPFELARTHDDEDPARDGGG